MLFQFHVEFFVLFCPRLASSIYACTYVDSVTKIFLNFFYLLFYYIFSRDDGL